MQGARCTPPDLSLRASLSCLLASTGSPAAIVAPHSLVGARHKLQSQQTTGPVFAGNVAVVLQRSWIYLVFHLCQKLSSCLARNHKLKVVHTQVGTAKTGPRTGGRTAAGKCTRNFGGWKSRPRQAVPLPSSKFKLGCSSFASAFRQCAHLAEKLTVRV